MPDKKVNMPQAIIVLDQFRRMGADPQQLEDEVTKINNSSEYLQTWYNVVTDGGGDPC
jgi:hypothetical protein